MRAAIGQLMARSKREIPHYYLADTFDLSAPIQWLAERNARRPVTERLLPAALLLKATALAAREDPALNGFWDEGFRPPPRSTSAWPSPCVGAASSHRPSTTPTSSPWMT